MSDNVTGAENQQGSPLHHNVMYDPSETTRRAPCSTGEICAYLQGALHDASRNKRTRVRFVQSDIRWLYVLQNILSVLGYKSWIYKEGATRSVYALETTAKFLDFSFDPKELRNNIERSAYIRGFFDAEGGIPRNDSAPFYIQLVQKDKRKIETIVNMLKDMDVSCGKIHNPSTKVDPNYWRVFVSTRSHKLFAATVGSWHPRKQQIFHSRMKI